MSKLTTIEVPVAPVLPAKVTLDLKYLKYAVMFHGHENEVAALFRWPERAKAYRDKNNRGTRIINIETGEVL